MCLTILRNALYAYLYIYYRNFVFPQLLVQINWQYISSLLFYFRPDTHIILKIIVFNRVLKWQLGYSYQFQIIISLYLSEIFCPSVNASANSEMEISNHSVLGTLTYSCIDGFEHTFGNLNRTCLLNGTWSGDPPNCSGTHCRNLTILRVLQRDSCNMLSCVLLRQFDTFC